MSRLFARFLLLGLALIGAWLLPGIAQAALVPICDAPESQSFVPPQEPACTVITRVDDETGETSVAPLCDPRGASAIAPPRLLAVSDARLDQSPSCGNDATELGLSPSSGDHAPKLPSSWLVDLALLPEPLSLGAACCHELAFAAAAARGPRSGERLDVYKPPRV
jgi:hypothetical protein